LIDSVELIIRQPGHPDRVVRLPEGDSHLGRAEDNDVVLSDVGVSRRHARLVVGTDTVRIEDLGSGNGTYFRGFRVQTQELQDGDEVIVDPFVLNFRIRGDLAVRPEALESHAAARLEVIVGAGMSRRTYPIGTRGLTLGRSENRDVVIPDPAASRHHCTILPRDGTFVLRDMGSANGVFVNSVRVRESVLSTGDRIRIGNTEMRFVVSDEHSAEPVTRDAAADAWRVAALRGDTYLQHEDSAPQAVVGDQRGSKRWAAMVAGAVSLLGIIAVSAVGLGALAYVIWGTPAARLPIRAPQPPTWALELPGGLPAATVKELSDQGIEAMRQRDNRSALVAFYRALVADPGDPYSERLAFLAGEFVVLDAMEASLEDEVAAHEARQARRDQLLADVSGGGARARSSLARLQEEYRDDPLVIQQMGWQPGEVGVQVQDLLDQATEAEALEKWADAAELYAQARATAMDPDKRRLATTRERVVRRELARLVAVRWRQGVSAEAWGRLDEARGHYQAVLEVDPHNASARLRLERLER